MFRCEEVSMKTMGRHFYANERLYLTYSGSEVGFFFSGDHLEMDVYSDKMSIMPTLKASMACLVEGDEEPFTRTVLEPGTQRVVVFDRAAYAAKKGVEANSLPEKMALHVIKLSEAAFGALAIEGIFCDDKNQLEALPEKKLKIEYIGDSITCGYGVEGVLEKDEFTTAQENPLKSFSIQSAMRLEADYQLCSWSGIGVISKYIPPEVDEPDTEVLIQEIYPYADLKMQERLKMEPALWEFGSFVPDIIVLNIGTNDASYTRGKPDREAHYADTMKKFIGLIHEKNPSAKLVFAYGVMDHTLCPVIAKMIEELKAEGHNYLYYVELPEQNEADGMGTDFHPSAVTQTKTGKIVADFIHEKVLSQLERMEQ